MKYKAELNSKGFTLMELLIVIAIIGILSTIALPTYRSYTGKARFSEVILATAPYKTAVSLALQEGDPINDLNSGQNGIPLAAKPTKNLASLTVSSGIITATATKAAGSDTYILTPDEFGSHWQVSGSCLTKGLCKS